MIFHLYFTCYIVQCLLSNEVYENNNNNNNNGEERSYAPLKQIRGTFVQPNNWFSL